jgi:ribosomal protein L16 Arg81 hydroxylase
VVAAIEELHAELPFSREMWSTFMKVYWQKKPLVIRGAIRAGSSVAIEADELAGLACEAEFSPRIIRKGEGSAADWALELGPFSEEELQGLPSNGTWSLLLNDLEKHVPEAAELLDLFDHFPRWRVADVQASISTNGGSVGAHSDQFDVFLIQADGSKRWSISDSIEYTPDCAASFFEDIDVRVLRDFRPQLCSVLEPGDALYLPPKVAHHGVAERCDTVCTTYSVGFLAPPHDDLVLSWAQARVDGRDDTGRWSDPWLEPQGDVGRISSGAVTQAADVIRRSMPKNEADVARWFGCHVTASYGFDIVGMAPENRLSAEDVLSRWREEGFLLRRADVKFAFVQGVSDGSLEGCLLFAGGNTWLLNSQQGIELACHIANHDEIEAVDWVGWINDTDYEINSESKKLVSDLYNAGFIVFPL